MNVFHFVQHTRGVAELKVSIFFYKFLRPLPSAHSTELPVYYVTKIRSWQQELQTQGLLDVPIGKYPEDSNLANLEAMPQTGQSMSALVSNLRSP